MTRISILPGTNKEIFFDFLLHAFIGKNAATQEIANKLTTFSRTKDSQLYADIVAAYPDFASITCENLAERLSVFMAGSISL